jgi:hypothetical protein
MISVQLLGDPNEAQQQKGQGQASCRRVYVHLTTLDWSPSRIPHGGLVWWFWPAVYLVNRANNEDVSGYKPVLFSLAATV